MHSAQYVYIYALDDTKQLSLCEVVIYPANSKWTLIAQRSDFIKCKRMALTGKGDCDRHM